MSLKKRNEQAWQAMLKVHPKLLDNVHHSLARAIFDRGFYSALKKPAKMLERAFPVDLNCAKRFLRIENDADDELVIQLIAKATDIANDKICNSVSSYGNEANDVPLPIRQAILLIIANLYEYYEMQNPPAIPMMAEALLVPYREGAT